MAGAHKAQSTVTITCYTTHNRNQRNGRQTINSASLKFLWRVSFHSVHSSHNKTNGNGNTATMAKYEAKAFNDFHFSTLSARTPHTLMSIPLNDTQKYRIYVNLCTKTKKKIIKAFVRSIRKHNFQLDPNAFCRSLLYYCCCCCCCVSIFVVACFFFFFFFFWFWLNT